MKELLISLAFIITFSLCAERNFIPEDIIDHLHGSYEKVPFRYYSGCVLFDVTLSRSLKIVPDRMNLKHVFIFTSRLVNTVES